MPSEGLFVWAGLISLAAVSFWAQAVITEERFVPALNVVTSVLDIPDDVAGATLMAAGASTPEVFASLTSLFITHSSLGIGTIVGSEIFNQLMICAGAVAAARTSVLRLNKLVVLREVCFYALAILFLLVALNDRRPLDDADDQLNHIFIRWYHAYLLLAGYIVYVLVCAYSDRIVQYWRRRQDMIEEVGPSRFDVAPEAPVVVRRISSEPSTNFETEPASLGSCSSASQRRKAKSKLMYLVTSRLPQPSALYNLEDLVQNDDGSFSCFLWQQSLFYDKARISSKAWQLRWFTFHENQWTSVLGDRSYSAKPISYPISIEKVDVDEAHLLVKIWNSGDSSRHVILLAPTPEILRLVLDHTSLFSQMPAATSDADAVSSVIRQTEAMKEDRGPTLISFPFGSSPLRQLIHVILYPLKLAIHFSVPDCRAPDANNDLTKAYIAMFVCIIWILIGSYAMVSSLEQLGRLMHIPNTVIGVTVSAAGTSLPNYVASRVAARQGLGNMAVSNAFGSNTFNIFVGLGLPWALYTTFLGEYSDLQDDGITISVVILAFALLIFVVLMFVSGFKLFLWHAYTFIALYCGYLVYAVGGIFWQHG